MQRVLRCAAVVAAMGLLAAGCGDDGEEGGGGSGEAAKPVTLKIGLIPIADVAPVFLGQKKGFFKEQQITLDPQFAAGGAAITPAVISGDFDIGFSNTVSLLIAGSKNLPVQIISQGVLGDADDSKVVGGPAGQEERPDQERPRTSRARRSRSTRSTTSAA